ncbi:MAG: hypothetical protein GY711_09425 [bacterium]|nr:hypothetical protein [bacterium]
MTPIDPKRLMRETAWMRRLARELLGDGARAEDAVQDACVLALERPPRARCGAGLRAWLARTLKSRVREHHRSHDRRRVREAETAREEAEPSAHGTHVETATDPSGAYRLDGVCAGSVCLVAIANGYRYTVIGPVQLSGGGALSGQDLRLDPLPSANRITGVVLDPASEPVPGAPVSAFPADGQENVNPIARTNADEEGGFLLSVVKDRRYKLVADDYQDRWCDARIEDVASGATDVRLSFPPTRELLLRVRDARGAPVDGVTVSIDSARSAVKRAIVEPEADGTVRVRLPGHSFRLWLRAHGYLAQALGPWEPEGAPSETTVTLAKAGRLRGIVRADSEPVPGTEVLLATVRDAPASNDDGFFATLNTRTRWAEVPADARGRFDVPITSRGSYALIARAPGRASARLGPFDLAADTELSGLVFELPVGGTLEGRVVLHGERDPTGTIVAASNGDGFMRTVSVASDGRYRFEHLSPGPWQVRKSDPEGAHRRSDFRPVAAGTEIPWDVTVVDGLTTRFDLDSSRVAPTVFTGRLAFDGAGAEGWRVTLWSTNSRWYAREILDGDGRFRIEAPRPGRYEFYANPLVPGTARTMLTATLELGPTGLDWSHDLTTCALDVTAPAAGVPAQDRAHIIAGLVWNGSGITWSSALYSNDEVTVRIPQAPAGSIELRRGVTSEIQYVGRLPLVRTIEVAAGASVRVAIDE